MFSKRTDWKLTPNRYTMARRKMQASGVTLLDLTASNPTRVGIRYDAESILFDFLADLQDVRLAPYPLIYDHGWQIDFPSLYKAVTPRTRALVLVHPNNPTGSYIHSEELPTLNCFCREYNLVLIVDEVFLDYPHDGAYRNSFVKNNDTLTFSLSGLSKVSGLPQMKVAWLAASG